MPLERKATIKAGPGRGHNMQKIIAEKDRRADPKTKQKGLRGNTICFPQAIIKELVPSPLPADPEASHTFFSESLCIVLAGCNSEDLDKATWAEVPREAYMTAIRFLILYEYSSKHIQV